MAVTRAKFGGLLLAVCLSAEARIAAQAALSQPDSSSAATGALTGKLTDVHSTPLAGVMVVVRNLATGAEARTTTGKNGAYHFAGLAAGDYAMEAESERLGYGQLEGIAIDAGHEARVQAAMQFGPQPVVVAAAATAATTVNTPLDAVAISRNQAQQQSDLAQVAPRTAPSTVSASTDNIVAEQPLQLARLSGQPIGAAPANPALRAIPPAAVAPMLAMSVGAALGAQAAIEASKSTSSANGGEPATVAATTEVSGAELQALPTSGRRWQEFALDTPASSSAAGSTQPSLRGSGQDPADTTIDSVSVRLAFGGAAGAEPSSGDIDSTGPKESGAREGWPGGRGLAVSEEAIGAVKIEAGNVEAEGAHAAGGRMSVETESGGSEVHGQASFFDRQNNWGARNPFTQWVENTGTAAAPNFSSVPYTPPDHESTWGVGLGSHIRRVRPDGGGLFWFGAIDSYRRNDPGLATVKDWSDFFTTYEPTSPEIELLSARLDESFNQANNDYLGVPGSGYSAAGLEALDGLLGPAPRTAAQWTGFGRLDWQATERQRFTLEGIGANWSSPGGGLTRVSETFGSHSFGASHASQEWLLGRWEAFITPNLLAVTQVSAGREILTARPDMSSTLEQGFLSGNQWGQLPQITVDSRYGFTIGNPSRFGLGSYPDEKLYHGEEMVDWARHSVLIKAGFELDHNYDATNLLRNQTGTYSYSKVQNFISDALAFEKFGLDADGWTATQQFEQHNCDAANDEKLIGALPCYSYYSQTIGPSNWNLSTNDWAGFATTQWQAAKRAVFSAGLRWELEQLPPALVALNNTALPLTEQLPALGSEWGPRVGLALGSGKSRWPVVRLGYGMYFGRTENATVETALTQTGSLKGDLNFFFRPTDGYNSFSGTSAAPLFPNVLTGTPGSVVTPGAVEFAQRFRNPEVHQALASIEETLPGRVTVTAAAMVSLGRRLPISMDTNFDPAVNPRAITYNVVDKTGTGPIKTPQITVPFYALWPSADCASGATLNVAGQCGRLNPAYQQITQIESRANSTYEAATIKMTRYGSRGLSLHAHYTYSHAMDWNPNESTTVAGSDVLDPADFREEYGTSNLDVRHAAAAMVVFDAPWKLRGFDGKIANGWMLSGIGQFHSGLPYSMRTTGSIPEEFDTFGNPTILGIGPGMNGSGGDNRVYGLGRNTFRYPQTWKADMRVGKSFGLGEKRQLEIMAESFNLFNHQNVTEIETTGYEIQNSAGSLPTLTYLTLGTTGTNATTAAFGAPLNINATNFYRERQFQFGARFRF